MTPPPAPEPTTHTSASSGLAVRRASSASIALGVCGGARRRARVAERRPVRVLAGLRVGRAVVEEQRHARERADARRRVAARRARCCAGSARARAATALRRKPCCAEHVEQLQRGPPRIVSSGICAIRSSTAAGDAHVGRPAAPRSRPGRRRARCAGRPCRRRAWRQRAARRSRAVDHIPAVRAGPPRAAPRVAPRRCRPPRRAPRPSGSRRAASRYSMMPGRERRSDAVELLELSLRGVREADLGRRRAAGGRAPRRRAPARAREADDDLLPVLHARREVRGRQVRLRPRTAGQLECGGHARAARQAVQPGPARPRRRRARRHAAPLGRSGGPLAPARRRRTRRPSRAAAGRAVGTKAIPGGDHKQRRRDPDEAVRAPLLEHAADATTRPRIGGLRG